jgi:hypothetical protein
MPQMIQRSFTGGEIAPALRTRADINKYTSGLAKCINFIIRSQGGAYSRPGTKFTGYLGQPSRKARLIPFQFNTEQTYIIVLEHLTMRFVRDGGFILTSPGGPAYEIVTPYTEDELYRVGFTQDADVMTLVHPNHDPRNLSRLDDDDWSLDVIDFGIDFVNIVTPTWPPTTSTSITNVTQANPAVVTSASHGRITGQVVTIKNVTGMIELNNKSFVVTVINANSFSLDGIDSTLYSAYVSGGSVIRGPLTTIGDGAGDYDKTYTYVVTSVYADGRESLQSDEQTITTKSLSETAGVRIQWFPEIDPSIGGPVYFRIYKEISEGSKKFGWIGDSDHSAGAIFVDFNIAPIVSDSPPIDNTPFSGDDNKPSCVSYYQQRQIFANTINNPQLVVGTQVGYYDSFRYSSPSRDDDSIEFTVKSNQVNEIRHIVELDSLILLTSGGEWRVTEGQDEVLTPSSIGIRRQSVRGASWVPPQVIGDSVVYLQDKNNRVRDIKYDFVNDKYGGDDLSIMAEHLFEGYEIIQTAYAEEPYSILWMVRSDGVLLGLTYQREHQVWAWHQHVTDGLVESIAVIAEDGRDVPYIVVKRNIAGTDTRYVERIEARITTSSSDVYCLDCGIFYNGVATTSVTGLTHLNGETVTAVADGAEITGLVVLGGAITLPRAASKVSVGLPYTCTLETLDLDIAAVSESPRGRMKSISKVIIEVEKSRGLWVGPKINETDVSLMTEIKPRFESDGYGPIALKTFKEELTIDPQWGYNGGLRLEQRSAFPLTILAVIPNVDVS